MSSKKLIEQIVSGKSAQYVIDALVEELPPLPAIKASISRDLPRGTKVEIDDEVVYIETDDRDKIREHVEFLSQVYPELDFVLR